MFPFARRLSVLVAAAALAACAEVPAATPSSSGVAMAPPTQSAAATLPVDVEAKATESPSEAVPTATLAPTETPAPTPTVAPTPTPAPTPIVHEDAVSVESTTRSAFRGAAGTTQWTAVSISPDRVLAMWQATAGTSACSFYWRLEDGYGSAVSGSVKALAGKSTSGSKTFDTSAISDASLTVTTTCRSFLITLGAAPTPTPKPVADTSSNCNPNYSGYCVPNVSYDLDCADVRHRVTVVGVDVYRLDGDHDGIGCESY